MQKITRFIGLAYCAIHLTSCGTIFPLKQQLKIDSYPSGADIYVDHLHLGKTPHTINVKNASIDKLSLRKDGYWPEDINLETGTRVGAFIWDFMFTGILGWGLDGALGGLSKYKKTDYHVNLTKRPVEQPNYVTSHTGNNLDVQQTYHSDQRSIQDYYILAENEIRNGNSIGASNYFKEAIQKGLPVEIAIGMCKESMLQIVYNDTLNVRNFHYEKIKSLAPHLLTVVKDPSQAEFIHVCLGCSHFFMEENKLAFEHLKKGGKDGEKILQSLQSQKDNNTARRELKKDPNFNIDESTSPKQKRSTQKNKSKELKKNPNFKIE